MAIPYRHACTHTHRVLCTLTERERKRIKISQSKAYSSYIRCNLKSSNLVCALQSCYTSIINQFQYTKYSLLDTRGEKQVEKRCIKKNSKADLHTCC